VSDGQRAIEMLREKFPDEIVGAGAFREQHWVEIKPERLIDICLWLRDAEPLFDFLTDVTAVHWPDDAKPIEMVYQLFSRERNDRLRLKAMLIQAPEKAREFLTPQFSGDRIRFHLPEITILATLQANKGRRGGHSLKAVRVRMIE